MKLIAVFATLLAVAVSYPIVKTWTIQELETAVRNYRKKVGDPAMQKYIEDALNQILYMIFTKTGDNSRVLAGLLSPSGNRKWTVDELKSDDEYTKMAYVMTYSKRSKDSSHEIPELELIMPALDISTWSITDLSEAIEDPYTNPALEPYLVKAKEEIKQALKTGVKKDNVTLVTPVGLIPVKDGTKPRIVAFKKLQ